MAGAKSGRLEAVWTLTATTITFDGSVAAPVVVNITAGPYTITSLIAFIVAALPGTWTVTLSSGETGTNKVTIDIATDRPFSVTWANANVRTWMGFAADIAAAGAAQTGGHCRGIWTAGVPKWSPHGDDDGNGGAAVRSPAIRQSMSAVGDVKTLVGSSHYHFTPLRWEGTLRQRAKLIGESVTNESFERFYFDAQLGDFALATPGSKLRIYWDADVATYTTVKLTGMRAFDPVRMNPNWVGRYIVELPKLVKTT